MCDMAFFIGARAHKIPVLTFILVWGYHKTEVKLYGVFH